MRDTRGIISTALVRVFVSAASALFCLALLAPEGKAAGPGKTDYYQLFVSPSNDYRPFVRWWWNGDKVEEDEIRRELRLLKDAGIGGVEINPISFPSKTDDMGKKSLQWLSREWMDMLKVAFDEAESLGLTCDLIVGSGWPFGAEDLEMDERAQVAIIYAEKLEGPLEYQCTEYSVTSPIDPGVTLVNPMRTPEVMSLKLVPEPMGSLDEVVDLSDQIGQPVYSFHVPEGKHVFYALVKYSSFASVINGAPGAAGPILDHFNAEAVRKYLDRMSDTIQEYIGPLSNNVRALFTDSMELEGSNWCYDFAQEFRRRNGYDLMPYLPFTMFKVGRLGAVVDDKYGVTKTSEFQEEVNRVRFDFEFTKAQLLKERFTDTYLQWCKDLGVKSRAQAYGRGFFPLESSLGYDIPEGESWTTNWLRHKIGEEMSDEDYRRGRGYTMIDKYVSSAAHLTGNRIVSCEEMTNTYLVFNASLEFLKIGSDQSVMSGITHTIWHGFNYSPPDAPFPGWVQYGSYYNEKNNWWPYFKYLNDYKARLSSQLQNADMYTDMAILPANYDLWTEMGVQTDPFPEKLNVPYTSIIWESINKCGGAADYTTEIILQGSEVREGKLCYGPKEYGTLFLVEVTSITPETMEKIRDFVLGGGKVICVEKYPEKAPGLKDYKARDARVKEIVEELKSEHADNFILAPPPEDKKYLEWYETLAKEQNLPHYMEIDNPDRFFMQTRYLRDDGSEFFFFNNAHRYNSYDAKLRFSEAIAKGRQAWVWDLDTGERWKLTLGPDYSFEYEFGPAESMMVVFDKNKKGSAWSPLPAEGPASEDISRGWEVELRHAQLDSVAFMDLDTLTDLKDLDATKHFSGTAVYRKTIEVEDPSNYVLNLGLTQGVTELFVNGRSCGVKWFGRRIYDISSYLVSGSNDIEVHVTTLMGNYLKSLTDNEITQKWVNRKGREQEYQPTGILGPATIYKKAELK